MTPRRIAAALLVSCAAVACASDRASDFFGPTATISAVRIASTVAAGDRRLSALLVPRIQDEGWAYERDDAQGGTSLPFTSPGWRGAKEKRWSELGARLPERADGPIEAGISRVAATKLTLRPRGAASVPGHLVEGHVVYPQAYGRGVDTVVTVSRDAMEVLFSLREPADAFSFAWDVGLPSGIARGVFSATGELRFEDGSGQRVLGVPAPYAVDAHGTRRETHLQWDPAGRLGVELDARGRPRSQCCSTQRSRARCGSVCRSPSLATCTRWRTTPGAVARSSSAETSRPSCRTTPGHGTAGAGRPRRQRRRRRSEGARYGVGRRSRTDRALRRRVGSPCRSPRRPGYGTDSPGSRPRRRSPRLRGSIPGSRTTQRAGPPCSSAARSEPGARSVTHGCGTETRGRRRRRVRHRRRERTTSITPTTRCRRASSSSAGGWRRRPQRHVDVGWRHLEEGVAGELSAHRSRWSHGIRRGAWTSRLVRRTAGGIPRKPDVALGRHDLDPRRADELTAQEHRSRDGVRPGARARGPLHGEPKSGQRVVGVGWNQLGPRRPMGVPVSPGFPGDDVRPGP